MSRIEIQQRDEQMRVFGQVSRNGLAGVTSHQLHFLFLTDEAICVELVDRARELRVDVVALTERTEARILSVTVFSSYGRKSLKRSNADDLTVIVVGLKNCRYVRPGHRSSAVMDSAFDKQRIQAHVGSSSAG